MWLPMLLLETPRNAQLWTAMLNHSPVQPTKGCLSIGSGKGTVLATCVPSWPGSHMSTSPHVQPRKSSITSPVHLCFSRLHKPGHESFPKSRQLQSVVKNNLAVNSNEHQPEGWEFPFQSQPNGMFNPSLPTKPLGENFVNSYNGRAELLHIPHRALGWVEVLKGKASLSTALLSPPNQLLAPGGCVTLGRPPAAPMSPLQAGEPALPCATRGSSSAALTASAALGESASNHSDNPSVSSLGL